MKVTGSNRTKKLKDLWAKHKILTGKKSSVVVVVYKYAMQLIYAGQIMKKLGDLLLKSLSKMKLQVASILSQLLYIKPPPI
jgi:hypothetical protein